MKAEAYCCGWNVKTCWLCCCLPVCCVKCCYYCSCSVAEESEPKKKCCTCKKSKKPAKKEKVDDEISVNKEELEKTFNQMDQKENRLGKVEKKSEAKREECSITRKMNCGKCK
ncbi:hypothetical protein Pint_34230 [Pistacia integerrima]|uniref:Uncharacterized protein n=1 Tax=Pistacia integerrima TaxID=434235 RepID=A0ACC0X2Y2_9ROSI|nr:hypothetical protein Pint_34230 [Pistacia integerrima]